MLHVTVNFNTLLHSRSLFYDWTFNSFWAQKRGGIVMMRCS